MKSKKSQEHSEFIRIALIVIIIIVCVYLVWHFILAKNAVARTFAMDIAKSAGISVEKEDRYSALAKEVAGILNQPNTQSAQSAYDSVKAKLTAEMKNVKPDEQYLLDRLVELNHNADANIAYMKIAPDFWNLKYNGVDEPSKFISELNNFKPRFEEVAKDYAGTVAAGEAQGQINLIAGISDCTKLDPYSGSCTPQATKNLCIAYAPGTTPDASKMVCAFATCGDAEAKMISDPDYCERLTYNSKICTVSYDVTNKVLAIEFEQGTPSEHKIKCVPCEDVRKKGCSAYSSVYIDFGKQKWGISDASQANVCGVEGGCVKKDMPAGAVSLAFCRPDCSSFDKDMCTKWSYYCDFKGNACVSKPETTITNILN